MISLLWTPNGRRAAAFGALLGGSIVMTIFAAIGVRSIEDIQLDHLEILFGFYTAIKDGETTIDDVFNPKPQTGRVVVDEKKNPYKAPEDAPEPSPAQSLDPVPESPVEVSEATERAQLLADIKATLAKNETTIAKFAPLCRSAKMLDEKVQIQDAPIDSLRLIHGNVVEILTGEVA